jgi:hypothetical protein
MPHACSDHNASICNDLVYIVGAREEGQQVCDLTRPRTPGARSRPHCGVNFIVPPLWSAGACTRQGDFQTAPVWSATTPPTTLGRQWRT